MDSGFLSLLFGGLFALAGTYLANHFALKRERVQWERQQRVDREKVEREEKEKAREHLREIYINCVRNLTRYGQVPYPEVLGLSEGDKDFDSLTDDKKEFYYADKRRYDDVRSKHFVEAQHWLWLLSINLPDIGTDDLNKFNEEMEYFIAGSSATELNEIVLNLARNDSRLKNYVAGMAELNSPISAPKAKELQS
jgi:hypothetical protein